MSRTNFVLAVLNLLFGGVATMRAALDAPGGAAQRSAVAHVHRAAASWDFGEGGAGFEAVEELLKQPVADYCLGSEMRAAVDLIPEKIKLPEQAGTTALLSVLPPDWADRYADEANIVRGGVHAEAAELLRGRTYNSPTLRSTSTRGAFLRRLWEHGMLRVIDEAREFVGMFAVPKGTDGWQRLIIDARCPNERWVEPPRVVQASGPLLARQLQRCGLRARMGKADLSNYYYQLEVPDWMSRWFALGELVVTPGAPPVLVGLRVLPMGCSHAVALGSTAHVEILRRAGFTEDRQLVEGRPLLTAGVFYAVVIDDLVVGGRAEDDGDIADLLHRALDGYGEVCLPVSMNKVEWPTDATKALGAELAHGEIGASRSRRQRLTAAFLSVATWSKVAPKVVESLVGHAIWAWLFRRCGLAVLADLFGFIDERQDTDLRVARPLSPRQRWECVSVGALLCFAQVSLRAGVSTDVMASDASLWGFGVVAAKVDRDVVDQAMRFCEMRGEHVSLDGAPARRPGHGERIADPVQLPPEWGALPWVVKIARPWRASTAPRVQAVSEMQAASIAAEWAARVVDHHGQQQLLLLDARAALGAWAKGRSSAYGFLRPLRRVAALSFATGIEWHVRWVPGELMMADAASRRFQPAKRDRGHDHLRGRRIGEAKNPGPRDRRLRGRHLAPATIRAYMRAVLVFVAWARTSAGQIRSVGDLECALCCWMEEQYESMRRAQIGVDAMSGIKMLSPTIHARLPEARALLVDWQSADKVQHWPPIPFPVLLLVVRDQLMRAGSPAVAFGLLVSYLACLRISEVTALRVGDVVWPGNCARRGTGVRMWGLNCILLILTHTKTGDDRSAELWPTWIRPSFAQYVERRAARTGRGGALFASQDALRAGLRDSLAVLGLSAVGFVPHSLRAGGALALLNAGVHIDEVLRRGRWRRPESARPYLQQLRAVAAAAACPPLLLDAGERLARNPGAFLRRAYGANLD